MGGMGNLYIWEGLRDGAGGVYAYNMPWFSFLRNPDNPYRGLCVRLAAQSGGLIKNVQYVFETQICPAWYAAILPDSCGSGSVTTAVTGTWRYVNSFTAARVYGQWTVPAGVANLTHMRFWWYGVVESGADFHVWVSRDGGAYVQETVTPFSTHAAFAMPGYGDLELSAPINAGDAVRIYPVADATYLYARMTGFVAFNPLLPASFDDVAWFSPEDTDWSGLSPTMPAGLVTGPATSLEFNAQLRKTDSGHNWYWLGAYGHQPSGVKQVLDVPDDITTQVDSVNGVLTIDGEVASITQGFQKGRELVFARTSEGRHPDYTTAPIAEITETYTTNGERLRYSHASVVPTTFDGTVDIGAPYAAMWAARYQDAATNWSPPHTWELADGTLVAVPTDQNYAVDQEWGADNRMIRVHGPFNGAVIEFRLLETDRDVFRNHMWVHSAGRKTYWTLVGNSPVSPGGSLLSGAWELRTGGGRRGAPPRNMLRIR